MYTTLRTESPTHMFCSLNFAISASQNWISDFTSSVISRVSHHGCRVFNKTYNSLVINLATGPKAMAIAIILPVKLAKLLAVSLGFPATCCNCSLRVSIFLVAPLFFLGESQYQIPARSIVVMGSIYTWPY